MVGREFRNKMIKHYWVDCLDSDTGEILLDRIDGTDWFGGLLENEKGLLEFEGPEFVKLINRIIDATEKYLRDRQ